MQKRYTFFLSITGILVFAIASQAPSQECLIEAEAFGIKGGWVIDQQFMDIMGSPYLLAHGMGDPVPDAVDSITFPEKGLYHLWVRTRDWSPFPAGPGRFQVAVEGRVLDLIFGSEGPSWSWQYGGTVTIPRQKVELRLKDLTGFDGRCDALFFSAKKQKPPDDLKDLDAFRRRLSALPSTPENTGSFDLAVCGGGMAGICAAVQAARLGCRVALIQDRPVLGGNNSSEIRVHLGGELDQNYFTRLGRIVRELDNGDPGNASALAEAYGDKRKLEVVQAEKNISLFLNMHVTSVEMEGTKIIAVIARHIENGREFRFPAVLFADCTGDGTVGFLAGAEYRTGRESREQTGENLAPPEQDSSTMGSSNLWYAVEENEISSFPECPWALSFSDAYHLDSPKGTWRWETGFGNWDTVTEAEEIRDHNLRAIYGNWSYLKNHTDKYNYWRLSWVSYISGKRESRRLLGDLILTQQDIQERKIYPDACVTTTWPIDLHFPDSTNSRFFPGQEFYSWYQNPAIEPYPIPFRCLYSRNITNLMMAGRNISVTHVALGTIRVMRTTGMMGEVLGYAAALCKRLQTTPRNLYRNHLAELIRWLSVENPG